MAMVPLREWRIPTLIVSPLPVVAAGLPSAVGEVVGLGSPPLLTVNSFRAWRIRTIKICVVLIDSSWQNLGNLVKIEQNGAEEEMKGLYLSNSINNL
jgi:hypothetical protein